MTIAANTAITSTEGRICLRIRSDSGIGSPLPSHLIGRVRAGGSVPGGGGSGGGTAAFSGFAFSQSPRVGSIARIASRLAPQTQKSFSVAGRPQRAQTRVSGSTDGGGGAVPSGGAAPSGGGARRGGRPAAGRRSAAGRRPAAPRPACCRRRSPAELLDREELGRDLLGPHGRRRHTAMLMPSEDVPSAPTGSQSGARADRSAPRRCGRAAR